MLGVESAQSLLSRYWTEIVGGSMGMVGAPGRYLTTNMVVIVLLPPIARNPSEPLRLPIPPVLPASCWL